jgi:ATP-dependent Clp protease protease subunit
MKPTNTRRKAILSKDDKLDNAKYWIEYGIDLEKRRISLFENIDETSIGWIVRAVRQMLDDSPKKPIDIYISSYGGYCYDGMALFDLLTSCDEAIIRTHAEGKVMSMGLIIYLAGDERFATPHTKFMAHSPSGGYIGKTYEAEIDIKELKDFHEDMLDILDDRTEMSRSWWKKQIRYEDKYFKKLEAKEFGIVTHEYEEKDSES